MSDYQDFCEAFGGSASDPDFMDNWLAKYCTESASKPSDLKIKIDSFDYESLRTVYEITEDQINQIKNYMKIFDENNFNTQKMANKFITENKLWNEFTEIRSLNDHGSYKNIPGILPKFYKITCAILKVRRGDGAALTNFKKY